LPRVQRAVQVGVDVGKLQLAQLVVLDAHGQAGRRVDVLGAVEHARLEVRTQIGVGIAIGVGLAHVSVAIADCSRVSKTPSKSSSLRPTGSARANVVGDVVELAIQVAIRLQLQRLPLAA
jgi:hypothetical protein